MKLLVTTPMSVILDRDDVTYIRAEDETGAFGILPGHADFLTVLSVSVVVWRNGTDTDHFIAVRGGIMTVRDGDTVEIATRDAVGDVSLDRLDVSILKRFREEDEAEERSRTSTTRMHLAAIRQVQHYLTANRGPIGPGALHPGGDAE
ncbi:F0F1 ATP synthase subunit epsilon [Rhodospirillaceae bacterium KN72]|uniref:ATP synthase epsilon chain n=1 Tax=Pacificispira spongiicola TaxID=2729598 RepID=A0A7Y0E3J0_9PROT|nr:F0F1 ATP synthase subunit epsilon [Pacificispira spongiicola]NMM46544.1 F0F1 ATP synthase subunit epsilon [Pacificispira spongiicola]